MKLRPYQVGMVNGAVKSLNRGRRPFVVAPTGSGKMIVIAFLAKHLDRNVLIVEHRVELIGQAVEKLEMLGERPGIIMSGRLDPNPSSKIKVGMIQTINRRELNWVPDVIIFDEAHLSAADSYNRLIAEYPSAMVVGFSATPERLDGRSFRDMFDEFVFGPTMRELTRMGHLVPIEYHEFDVANLKGLKTKGRDWDQDQVADILSESTEDVVATWLSNWSNRPTVVFASNTKQSKMVCEEFRSKGVAAEHIDGTTKDSVRKSIMHRVKTGKTRVLCNCGIVIEGFDAPLISCVMLLIATKSLSKYLQCIGRGTRPCEGKENLVVADFGKCRETHGDPDEDRDWSLDGKPRGGSPKEYYENTDESDKKNVEKYREGVYDYGIENGVVADRRENRTATADRGSLRPRWLPKGWEDYWDQLEVYRKSQGFPPKFSEDFAKAEINRRIREVLK